MNTYFLHRKQGVDLILNKKSHSGDSLLTWLCHYTTFTIELYKLSIINILLLDNAAAAYFHSDFQFLCLGSIRQCHIH
ncbi:hypothetical protein PAV_10c01520 [Paenibacillus alvei DSM 29]|nr:hypothetical protein PAV_10c01520 [Paenibacillus alvei DSM 29]